MFDDTIAFNIALKNNIQGFGGNPEMINLYGMSTGANSVACLISVPSISKLCSGAICQGAIGTLVNSREHSTKVAYEFMRKLKLLILI